MGAVIVSHLRSVHIGSADFVGGVVMGTVIVAVRQSDKDKDRHRGDDQQRRDGCPCQSTASAAQDLLSGPRPRS